MLFQNNKYAFYRSNFNNFTELTWLTSNVVSMAMAPPYTVPNLKPQNLSYHIVYHLFEGKMGDTSSKFSPSGCPTINNSLPGIII